MFFLFQVADQLYLLNKEDAQEHVLTKYMITVHQCLLASLSADPAGLDSTKLQATRLVEGSTRQWLNKVLEQIAAKVCLKAAAAMKAGLAASDKALSDLKLVPLCDEEINYRNHMAKHTVGLAQHGSKLKAEAESLSKCLQALQDILKGHEGQAGIKVDVGLLGGLEETIVKLSSVSATMTCHVTWYACMTIFRSTSAGGKSGEAQKTASKLLGLVSSFLHSEWPRAPHTPKLPAASISTKITEMVDVAAWII